MSGTGRSKRVLQALRGGELALHARFVLRQLLVQPRVFERYRQMRRQNHERLHVVFGEIIHLRAFEVEHAHNAALVNHRNRQLGPRLRIHHDVARIERHVRNANRLCRGDRRPDNSFVRR